MTVVSGSSNTGLIARIQNILTKPAAEWDVINTETATVQGLYTGYACILAAIPAIATIIGGILFTHMLVGAIIGGVLSYVLSLVGVFVIALIVDMLAPSFGAQKSQIQAMKLVVYANTAAWVAGIGGIFPPIAGILALVGGIYTLYTMYLGLPKLMKSPADKTTVYFIIIIVVAVVIEIVIALVAASVLAMFVLSAAATGAAAMGGVH
jgi:hypothetical protein